MKYSWQVTLGDRHNQVITLDFSEVHVTELHNLQTEDFAEVIDQYLKARGIKIHTAIVRVEQSQFRDLD